VVECGLVASYIASGWLPWSYAWPSPSFCGTVLISALHEARYGTLKLGGAVYRERDVQVCRCEPQEADEWLDTQQGILILSR